MSSILSLYSNFLIVSKCLFVVDLLNLNLKSLHIAFAVMLLK